MPHPTAPRPSPAADRASPEPDASPPEKTPDLTVNKVIAGAGAAATSAVLGSYFGATGTVAGAALGSVASTVATTLYQRSLDRTRDTILARVRLSPGRRVDLSDTPTVQLTVPQPRLPAEPETRQLHVEPVLRRPRLLWLWAGATVLVFVIGLLVVTGLEWAKGSSLTTGQPGTSVGRVLTPPAGGNEEDRGRTEPTPEQPTPSAEPTREPESTREPTSGSEPTPSSEPGSGIEPSRERGSGTATPQPTPELRTPGPDQND